MYTAIPVSFGQSTFSTTVNQLLVQVTLVVNIPSSTDFSLKIVDNRNMAIGEGNTLCYYHK